MHTTPMPQPQPIHRPLRTSHVWPGVATRPATAHPCQIPRSATQSGGVPIAIDVHRPTARDRHTFLTLAHLPWDDPLWVPPLPRAGEDDRSRPRLLPSVASPTSSLRGATANWSARFVPEIASPMRRTVGTSASFGFFDYVDDPAVGTGPDRRKASTWA